jgi:hypothetical protein
MIKSPLFESDEIKNLLRLFVRNYCDQQLKKNPQTVAATDATPETPVTNDSCLSISDCEVTTSTSDDATSSPQSASPSQTDKQATSQQEPINDQEQLVSKWDKLEVFGSLHIRSNNIRVLSCLVDEQLSLNETRFNEMELLLTTSNKYDQRTTSTQTCPDTETNNSAISVEKRKNDTPQQQQAQKQQQCTSSLSSMSPPLSYNSSNYEQTLQKNNLQLISKLENDDETALKISETTNGVADAQDQYPFNKKLKAYHQFYNKRKMSEPNKIISRNGHCNGIVAIGENDDYCEDIRLTANKIPMINNKKTKPNKRRNSLTFQSSNHESRRSQAENIEHHKNDDVDSYLNTSSYTTSLSSSRSRSPSTDRGSSILSKHNMSITMSLDRLSSSRSRSRSRSMMSSRSLTSRSSSISSLNYSRRKLLKQSKALTMCGGSAAVPSAPPPTRAIMSNEQMQRDPSTLSQQYMIDKQAIKCEMNGFYMNESEMNAINALAMNAVGGLNGQNGNQAVGQTMDGLFGSHHHHHHHGHHHHSLTHNNNQNKLLCKKQQYIMREKTIFVIVGFSHELNSFFLFNLLKYHRNHATTTINS